MSEIQNILRDPNWQLKLDVDPNEGGDGQHVRFWGDTKTFRTLASLLITMADSVDDSASPESEHGWHFALSDELPQLEIENASLLVFNCQPASSE